MHQPASFATAERPKRAVGVVLRAGLLAGTLDILAAITLAWLLGGTPPIRVLQYVASGIFGTAAFSGGRIMAVWGLLAHYLIALGFAAFFVWLYPWIRRVLPNPIITGLLYGLLVWVIMNQIVLPLSNAPATPFDLIKAIRGIVVLMLAIGLPIALIVHRHFLGKSVGGGWPG